MISRDLELRMYDPHTFLMFVYIILASLLMPIIIYLSVGHQEGSASHPPGSLPGAMVALEREAYTKQHATPELLF